MTTDVMIPAAAKLRSVTKENHDTFSLVLDAPEGSQPFKPGQFSMLYVFGAGELPISISGDPQHPDRLVYTVRSVGPVTCQLVTRKPGECIGVRGPFGASWPLEQARGKSILIVAGGIGLAPLRPAVYSILRRRGDYDRLIVLYGARSPRDILYKKELNAWGMLPGNQVLAAVDYGGVSWRGPVGVVTTLFRSVRLNPAETVALLCGPEIMMRYSLRDLLVRGFPPENIALSMERNMKCAAGFCGHCQLGPYFVCKDGPVFSYPALKDDLDVYEL